MPESERRWKRRTFTLPSGLGIGSAVTLGLLTAELLTALTSSIWEAYCDFVRTMLYRQCALIALEAIVRPFLGLHANGISISTGLEILQQHREQRGCPITQGFIKQQSILFPFGLHGTERDVLERRVYLVLWVSDCIVAKSNRPPEGRFSILRTDRRIIYPLRAIHSLLVHKVLQICNT